jgi:hypothetical protein
MLDWRRFEGLSSSELTIALQAVESFSQAQSASRDNEARTATSLARCPT